MYNFMTCGRVLANIPTNKRITGYELRQLVHLSQSHSESMLSLFVKEGLITSQPGKGGGYQSNSPAIGDLVKVLGYSPQNYGENFLNTDLTEVFRSHQQ